LRRAMPECINAVERWFGLAFRAMERANEVLEYWFGVGALDASRLQERSTFWFGGDGAAATAARDAEIRERLEPLLERAARGELASWASGPKRRLALIILLDQ